LESLFPVFRFTTIEFKIEFHHDAYHWYQPSTYNERFEDANAMLQGRLYRYPIIEGYESWAKPPCNFLLPLSENN